MPDTRWLRADPGVPRRVHDVSVRGQWFVALAEGLKTSEVRRLHRDYQRGDYLRIRNEEDPSATPLTFEVTHVLPGRGDYGLLPGYAVLSLRRVGAHTLADHPPARPWEVPS